MTLEHKDLRQLLETAIVAARLAGQRAMEEISYTKSSVKNNQELVTQADAICQKIIIDRIKETYPDHGFLAEEGTDGKIFKQNPRTDKAVWWVIDPIDGTNNFAHQILSFSVSIAAVYESGPVVGVVFEPATDSMFTAVKDGEAQLNGRKIVAGEKELERFSCVSFDSHFEDRPNWVFNIIEKTYFRNFGSAAIHLGYVAKGGLAGAIFTKVKLWDIAAGTIIAETAGAIVTDWQGNKIFPLNPDNYQGQSLRVLAANKKAHTQLLEMIKS